MTYQIPIAQRPLLTDPPFVIAIVLLATALGLHLLSPVFRKITPSKADKAILSVATG